MYEFFTKGADSLLEMPEMEDTVRLLLLLLLLPLDSDLVDVLDLEDLPDSVPDLETELPRDSADLVLLAVLDVLPDLVERPVLEERAVLEEISDMSERLDETSEMEESLVLEVRSDTVDKAVVDLFMLVEVFCSTSGCALMAITTASPPPHSGLHADHR